MTSIIKKKICLLGSFGVGKTSLVRRFVYDVFDDLYLSTIGVKVSQKSLPAVKRKDGSTAQVELIVWDIEGQDKFSDYMLSYYTGAAGAILVADLTWKESWQVLPELVAHFKEVNPEAVTVLAANKVDLILTDQEQKEALKQFAKKLDVKYFFTSAKTGAQVETVFTYLAQNM